MFKQILYATPSRILVQEDKDFVSLHFVKEGYEMLFHAADLQKILLLLSNR